MTTMKKLEDDNKSFGAVSFGSKLNRVLIIPWGPKTGMWRVVAPRGKVIIERVKMNWEFSYQTLRASKACFFSKGERMCVAAMVGVKDENAHRMASSRLTHAYAQVPEWAKTEIRRWHRRSRMTLARVLYHTGEVGVTLLKQDPAVWTGIFLLALEGGVEEKLEGLTADTDPMAILLRLFPKSAGPARSWALKEFRSGEGGKADRDKAENAKLLEAYLTALTTHKNGDSLLHLADQLTVGRYVPTTNEEVLKKLRGKLTRYRRPFWVSWRSLPVAAVLRLYSASRTVEPTDEEVRKLGRAWAHVLYGPWSEPDACGRAGKPLHKEFHAVLADYALEGKPFPEDKYELEMALLARSFSDMPRACSTEASA